MDLYQVLGVRRSAGAAEIRRAYQKAARLLHPHLNPGDPVAAERFRAVFEAFEVLADPQRRGEYDRGDPGRRESVVPEVGFAGFDFTAEVRVGHAGTIRDLFEDVLARPGATGGVPSRGEDLESSVRIAFDECFRPVRRRIHLVRLDRCRSCQGKGALEIASVKCPECAGAGQVRANRGRMIFTRRCAECAGSGVVRERDCDRCDGEGREMRSEWIDVEIPAGTAEGARLRIAGAGNVGLRGGPTGDFLLAVQIEPHAYYRREGQDLHCEVPITITEAALGAHVDVPTPDGAVTIEIPAGTQGGQRFRLRKRGLPKPGSSHRGDLYVSARVWVPRVDDDESRELLREFARRNPNDPRKDSVRRAERAFSP